ncbi:hypothetical protein HELRODRAFT_89960, partial [Helobdella robusta]|uniref:Ubiquitin carboxyl-terminal hydrolase n=1 Tax=Helobdella robusta TaxID=6412 RepID=T1G7J7_HELRO
LLIVNVKWCKEKFENVECNTDEPPLVFKARLFSLSGVQPDRQKIMIKGAVLKDDSWDNVKITNNANLLMIGSAEELPTAPGQTVVFMEDMTDSQLAKVLEVPSGLTNLGNTCYMNATLQCLRSVAELKETLKNFQSGPSMLLNNVDSSIMITSAMKELFKVMDRTSTSIPPILMLNVLHTCYPQFAEKNDHGQFQQQDANECWVELIRCLQKALSPTTNATTSTSATAAAAASDNNGFIDQFFSGEFQTTMKCTESTEEAESKSTEKFYQLSCFIEKEVKYMHTGLKSGLEGEITKHSPTLNRDATYTKTSKLSRLPSYLSIQMVRFFYKEKNAVSAKILKDIKFPLVLDVFDLCTSDLQKKLVPVRLKFKEEEDKAVERKNNVLTGVAANNLEVKGQKKPFSFEDDPGSNNSGYYELQAVLTHKGRSSSSGHYVAWVRGKKSDEWMMFDDDNVVAVTSEDILKLSGGGDWHCAYVLLYGPRILEITDDLQTTTSKGGESAKNDDRKMDMS